MMDWRKRLAAIFVMLALVGCAQGVTSQYAPYSPENDANFRDRGGGVDGGGGGGM